MTRRIKTRANQSLDRYLQEIGEVSLLTPEEEIELARKIKKDDQTALEKLTKANLRFVVSVAKQYQNQGLSLGDLIKEVVRSFEYFTSNKEGSPVTKIILSGGGSMVPGMYELLSEELEVPVEPLNPFANTSFSPDRVAGLIPELGPLFAVPVGCALREISSI